MWSRGIEYRKRQKERLSRTDERIYPFDVFVKNGELVSWRQNGSFKRSYQFYKKYYKRNLRHNKSNMESLPVKSNHYRKIYNLQYSWI